MKIKESTPKSPEEIERVQKQRAELARVARQEENKQLVRGNIDSSNSKRTGVSGQDRFYLPVLHINDPTQWEEQPKENRLHFTDKTAYNVCIGNCCGVPGLKAGCCYLDPEDMEHVLGPVDEEWVQDTVKWLRKKGIMATRTDVVIDFEEGKVIGEKFFSGVRKEIFLQESTYPILRFQVVGPRFACKFLNPLSGKCTIYEKRPQMCSGYLCQYVKKNFLVRTPDKPNTYTKIR